MKKKLVPRFKRKISSFLSEEDGNLNKHAFLAASAFLRTGAILTINGQSGVSHSNSLSIDLTSDKTRLGHSTHSKAGTSCGETMSWKTCCTYHYVSPGVRAESHGTVYSKD